MIQDLVNSPPHYTSGRIEAITYIKDKLGKEGYRFYLEGTIHKYMHRFRLKGAPVSDLKKMQWYLNALIDEYENHG